MCTCGDQERGRRGISAKSTDVTVIEMRAVRVPLGSVTAFPCKRSNVLLGAEKRQNAG